MSGYIVTNNATNSFSCEKNALQEQIREYIKVCCSTSNASGELTYKAYGGIELHVSVLPSVVRITPQRMLPSVVSITPNANQDDDCGWLLAEAIEIDAEQVDLSFKMWNTTVKIKNTQVGKDDMLYRSNILAQMLLNDKVIIGMLVIINNRRFWKQAGYKQSDGAMMTYILFTRFDFVVDTSGDSNQRLKNSNNGQNEILERKNVIILAVDLLKFFGMEPFDIELPYNVKKSTITGQYLPGR